MKYIDKSAAIQTLLQAISAPYPSVDAASPHPVDLPHTSRLYKTLLQGGHFNHTTKEVERAPQSRWNAQAFALQFVDIVDGDVMTAMCVKGDKNGAFVIAELCGALIGHNGETTGGSSEAEVVAAKEKVKRCFGKSVIHQIREGDGKGKKVLLDKIALL